MRRLLLLPLALLLIAGADAALAKKFFLSRGVQGTVGGQVFTAITMSPLTFTAGAAGTVGNAAAVVSTGVSNPTWTLQNSGVDSTGATCNNYSSYFTVSNSSSAVTSTGPSGPALTTSDGTWTWGAAASGRPGEYNVLLNGTQAGIGTMMEVVSGVMYVNTLVNGWYVYNSGFSNSAAPVTTAGPGGVVSVNASAPAQSYPGTCLVATQAGVGNSPFSKAFTLVGTGAAGASFTQIALSNLSFPSGTAGNVGTATSTVSSGVNSPTWSIKTSGVDNANTQCVNYPYFSITTSGVPSGITFSPANPSILDTSPVGTLISTANVAMSDGSSFAGALTSSNPNLFAVSGLNIRTARTVTTADSGASTSITATQNGQTGLLAVNASAPGQNYPGVCLTATQSGVSNSPYTQAFTLVGTGGSPHFTGISLSNLNFSAGVAGNVGTATSTVSSGANTPAWSLKTTGADNLGTACQNYSAYLSINSSTGVLAANSSAPAQSYPGTCVQATQAIDSNSPFSQAFTLVGSAAAPIFSGITMSSLNFATGTAGTVGTATAVVSSGPNAPTWSIKTSGVDSATGATCNNYSADFSINSSTGVVSNTIGAPAQSYPGTCLQATQAADSNSPFSQAFTLVGTTVVSGVLTTFTFQNLSGATLPAGSPVSFGQGFRYGDIMPGQHPDIRDASTHVSLAGQQWDEISTWRENGGNNSWRHAVWSAWLPNSLANGATYQVEFFAASGSYSENPHQSLSVLCTGPAAHDLKIHLSDVRGQDDLVRNSGDATFRVCDNITNVGRDAIRHIRGGNVYDEYVVSGLFVYATTGDKDPLLYATCNIDIFTKSSDGTSAGDVRWVCEIHNAWMNVAASSTGNAGNIGPAGFANDPQSISYRPEVLDGAVSVLNWASLDATVSSANNPIQPIASAGCYGGWGDTYCMDVPTATGTKEWYAGMAVRPSCSATCVGGINNGQLYYVSPVGSGNSGAPSTKWALRLSPNLVSGPFSAPVTSSQGTGTTTFSFRTQSYHWNSILLLDQTGQNNWSPIGTTTRVTRKVYPNFTNGEKLYWEQTGLIIPLNLAQSISTYTINYGQGESSYYNPNTVGNVIGGSGGGDRPDLGIINKYASQAFIVNSEANWDYARLFTLGEMTYGNATLLNEATGRIPAINNGPPIGPGGNGTGTAYSGLGAPRPLVEYNGFGPVDMAAPAASLPNPNYPAAAGPFSAGSTYIAWMPSFNGTTYEVFGDRHWLDMMRFRGNADYAQQRAGPGPEHGQGYYRDNNARFSDGNVYHYYGLQIDCCQGRGQAWMMRDLTYPAAFGSDSDIERTYYNDFAVENRNYYPMFLRFKDGPTQDAPSNTNFSTSIVEPSGYSEGVQAEPFIETYLFHAAWQQLTFLHEPLASTWMKQWQRYVEGNCGSRLAGAMPYYCFDYFFSWAINNGGDGSVTAYQGGTGLYTNGTDASDFGVEPTVQALGGGQWSISSSYVVTVGDQLMHMWGYHTLQSPPKIDQFDGTRYYSVIGPVDNTNHTFYIQCTAADHTAFPSQCPVAGQAFTGFTVGGSPITNTTAYTLKMRLTYDSTALNGYGYSSPNYMQYGGGLIIGLKMAGYNVTNALAAWDGPRLGAFNPALPLYNWDRTIVIPGLPTAVNSIP